VVAITNATLLAYSEGGRVVVAGDLDELEGPLASLIHEIQLADGSVAEPLRAWVTHNRAGDRGPLSDVFDLPQRVSHLLGLRVSGSGQIRLSGGHLSRQAGAVVDLLSAELPPILGELSRHPDVADAARVILLAKLAALRKRFERQPTQTSDSPRLPSSSGHERRPDRREHVSLAELRARPAARDIDAELDNIIGGAAPDRDYGAARAPHPAAPRHSSGARGGGGGGSGWDGGLASGRHGVAADALATGIDRYSLPTPDIFFGLKESDIPYPHANTDRNRLAPGEERGFRMRAGDDGSMEFFTAKNASGKRPLSILEMVAATENCRTRMVANIATNKPPSWSDATLQSTITTFNTAYNKYIHGTLLPQYDLCSSVPSDTMLRAIQDFDAKLRLAIFKHEATWGDTNSYLSLIVNTILNANVRPAPAGLTRAASGPLCRFFNQQAGCSLRDCTYTHKCRTCNARDHGAAECSRHKRPAGGGGGGSSGGGGGGGGGKRIKAAGRRDRDRDRTRGRDRDPPRGGR